MIEPLIMKLEGFGPIPEDDKTFLRGLKMRPRDFDAKKDIIREGDEPSDVHLVVSGLACRYKVLPGGKRQIVAFLVPGDFCDLHVFILNAMDHSIATLAKSLIIDIPHQSILAILERPALSRALLMATMVDEAVLREWVTNLGQRPAEQRIAHLFCELHARLRVVGLTTGGKLTLPITQLELADTVGLSTVHVNRSLQYLREEKLIVFKSGELELPDMSKLEKMCGFRANYLHLENKVAIALE